MQKPVRNPFARRAVMVGVAFAASAALIVQPWVFALRVVGVFALINCIPLMATGLSYARKWKRMLEHPLLETPEGTVYEGGAMKDGEMHFLYTSGCRVEACAFEGGVFTLTYTFGRKKERNEVSFALPVPPGKEQDALAAVSYYHNTFIQSPNNAR